MNEDVEPAAACSPVGVPPSSRWVPQCCSPPTYPPPALVIASPAAMVIAGASAGPTACSPASSADKGLLSASASPSVTVGLSVGPDSPLTPSGLVHGDVPSSGMAGPSLDPASLVEIPIQSLLPGKRRFEDLSHFVASCVQPLPRPVLGHTPTPSTVVPFTPRRRSLRIAKLSGAETPGILTYAVRSLMCRLGFTSKPEEISDDVFNTYIKSFDEQLHPDRVALSAACSCAIYQLPPLASGSCPPWARPARFSCPHARVVIVSQCHLPMILCAYGMCVV